MLCNHAIVGVSLVIRDALAIWKGLVLVDKLNDRLNVSTIIVSPSEI